MPIRAKTASAASRCSVVWALIGGADVLEELTVGAAVVLLLIVVDPFEADGQKLPFCCRQLNWVTTSGSTGVPSGRLTKSRKASDVMDPARGSFRAGHMIQGKPCEPSKFRVCSTASPFPSRKSTSLGVLMMGVPSRSRPFLAASRARVLWLAGVKAAGV